MTKIYQVDSFSNEHFKGNPAGVMILNNPLPEERMQQVAEEMNLSETAFVWPQDNKYFIRYFTPTTEVPLCGHATLAAAHILWEQGFVPTSATIEFQAPKDLLSISLHQGWITMEFPTYDFSETSEGGDFENLTGIKVQKLYSSNYDWKVVLVEDQTTVENFKPNFSALVENNFGHLMLTAKGDKEDYVVRCFAPISGINEDPVTGSAQCALTPIWNNLTGKTSFISKQVSKRTGILKTELIDNRIKISGQAITFFEAEIKTS